MLVIRKQQMEVFRQLRLQEFEDRTYERLLRIKPKECAAMGERTVRLSIRQGIQRAIHYGIGREADARKYIDIMFALGDNFDTDSRYPWAAEIANDRTLSGEAKVTRLSELTAMELAALKSQGRRPVPDE